VGDHSQQSDQQLAARALQKRRGGEKLTQEEARVLRRIEAAAEERRRWEYYATLPKKHYVELSGRPTKVLNEQADRYGFPLRGKTIDLGAVLRSIHDFLARHKHTLAAAISIDDPLLEGASQSLKNAYVKEQIKEKREKAALARLDRQEREHELLSRDEVHDSLARIASIIRGCGDAMQRRFGPEALEILNDSLDSADREIESLFQNGFDQSPDTPTDRNS